VQRHLLPGTAIELVRPFPHRRPRAAVFDFDGTLSLIRGGWTDLMVGMMFESLGPLARADESPEQLRTLIRTYVLSLNGAPTIFQMERFAKEIRDRGGNPEPAPDYHQEYLRRLGLKIAERKTALRERRCTEDDLTVPGTRKLLQLLVERDVELTLASGTEIEFVREEAALLKIADFFEGRIFAPGSEPRAFAKKRVMEELLLRHGDQGTGVIGVGDGQVETQAMSELGGLAIGVACDEQHRSGVADEAKRPQLIDAGAAVIVPDYRHAVEFVEHLWERPEAQG